LLSVRDAWFCESLNLRSDDRERAQVLGRAWIVECQELDGLNKMTGENLKKFLSESIDTYRKPYEKNARQYPRHCIIVGTTNESDYLRDLTGNRRFWPVRVGRIDLDGLSNIIDQMWAEAAVREAAGESVTLSPELWTSASIAQADRVAEDPYADVISGALGDGPGKISMDAIKTLLGIPTAKLTAYDARRIRAAMEEQGWCYSTYRLWVAARQERRPVRGFLRAGGEVNSPEIGVRILSDGQVEVGEISMRGAFTARSPGTNEEEDIPF
jgi:predicted P-loop ATPase